MSLFSLGTASTVGTTTVPSYDMRAGTAVLASLMEFWVNNNAATQSTWGLGRPANDATPPVQTSGVAFLAEDPGTPASNVTAAVAWSTAPTVPANFFRRIGVPATIGAGMVYTWPRGLRFAASRGLVLWNIAASSANFFVNATTDE